LAIAAFAMFNRSSQYVAEDNLNDDLEALLNLQTADMDRLKLAVGQLLIGRFFFLHVSTADSAIPDRILRTYEFTHATFGEYLVAWLTVLSLPRLPDRQVPSMVAPQADDALLAALLSHAALVSRPQVISFLLNLVNALPDRGAVHRALLIAFQQCLQRPAWQKFESYRPSSGNLVDRLGIYSANLFVLVLITSPSHSCLAKDLFGKHSSDELRQHWEALTRLWLSRLVSWGAMFVAFEYADDEIRFVPERVGSTQGLEQAQLIRLIPQVVSSVDSSGNTVVIHTPTGAGEYLAKAIERADLPEVISAFPTDDTVLLVIRWDNSAQALATRILAWAAI
jgi:hypothetical protein